MAGYSAGTYSSLYELVTKFTSTYSSVYETEGGVVTECQGTPDGIATVAGTLTVEVTSSSLVGSGLFEIFEGGQSGISVIGGSGSAEAQAQGIIEQGSLSAVWLRLGKVGTPTDNVYVNATSRSLVRRTSNSVAAASLPGPPGGTWTEFTFTPPLPIVSSLPTRIELERDGARDGSNWAYWCYDLNNPYARGVGWSRMSGVWEGVPSATPELLDFQTRLIFLPGGPRGRTKVTADLSGNLTQLNGTTGGTSTVTSNLYGGGFYSSVGAATVTADLTNLVFQSLGGATAGTSTATGLLTKLSGNFSAVGVATVTGTLDIPVAISVVSTGTATVSGFIDLFQGITAGTSTVYSDLTLGTNNLPAPPVAGTSTVTGTLAFLVELYSIGCIRAGRSFATSYPYMGFFDGTSTNEGLAQRMWAAGGTVSFIKLRLWKVGAPTDNIRVRVRPLLAQFPSIADSDWVDGSTLTGLPPGMDVTFTFATPPTLGSNTPYFVQLDRDGGRDETHYYRWAAATI